MKNVIRKLLLVVATSLSVVLVVKAQPTCTVTHYGEDDGLSQWRISQMLQDESGFIWISTWNGLDRFDGYEFVNFKAHAGDGVTMLTDRLRDMRMSKEGDIYVKADVDWFRFSRMDGSFSHADAVHAACFENNIKGRQSFGSIGRTIDYRDRNGVMWHIDKEGNLSYKSEDGISVGVPTESPLVSNFYMSDRQGNLWLFGDKGIYRLSFALRPSQHLSIVPKGQGSCAFLDRDGNYWLTTRSQLSTVQVFDCHNNLLGYLDPSGQLRQTMTEFGSPIYCMRQMRDGTIWMGSKPDGLFRLRPNGNGNWQVDHMRNLPHTDVYDIVEDSNGRLWIATMGGGIAVSIDKDAKTPHFIDLRAFPTYPKTKESKVRRLHITEGNILIATTTEGLLVGRIPKGNLRQMTFRMHQREADRPNSLSSNATMDILETFDHRVFISTESGGVNEVGGGENLLSSVLEFKHYDMATGLNSDIAWALASQGSYLWIVGSTQLMRLNLADGTFDYLDSHFFHEPFNFSECRPLQLPDGQWVFGVSDGFISLSEVSARKSMYVPPIVLTGIDKQGSGVERSVNHLERIVLQPCERSLIVHFAAIDTDDPKGINYAFKMEDDVEWNYIGHNRSASFAGLEPGTYHLQLRSTNADGVWVDNVRTLEIIVKPRFFEAWYGQSLLLLILLGFIGAAVYVYLYIRRIRREQQATLQAYLEFIGRDAQSPADDVVVSHALDAEETKPSPYLSKEDEAFMARVMQFVESHIGDADANVNDMAAATATSRSGLNRKMKALVGLTPADFLREARIKKACQLLCETSRPVSEVAYSCGFTDPKYFAKCFRTSVGKAPTEYRSHS